MMLLTEFVERYLSRRDVSPAYAEQLRIHAKAMGDISLKELSAELLNQHLSAMRLAGSSKGYRRSRRRNVLVLWNAAADDGLVA